MKANRLAHRILNRSASTTLLATCIAAAGTASLHAATVSWTGTNGTSWQTAGNWSSNPAFPAAGDDVAIGNVPLVTFGGVGSPTATVRSLVSNAASFQFQSGTLSIAADSFIASLSQSGATLRGLGTVSVGAATITGGTFSDSGVIDFQGSTAVSGAGIVVDKGRTLRNTGTMTFDSGAFVNWIANLNPTGLNADSGHLRNAGTLDFKTYLNRTHTIVAANNIASATFDNDAGALLKKTGDGSITMGVAMNNRGTIDVGEGFSPYGINFYGGKLDHQAGGALKGSGGVLLQVNGSAFRAGSSTTIDSIHVWGATTIESGAVFDPGHLFVRAGHTVTRAGADALVWRTETLHVDGTLALPQNVPLVVQGGLLTGAGTIRMAGAATATQPVAVDMRNATLSPGYNNAARGDVYAATLTVDGGLKLASNSNVEIDFVYMGGFVTNPVVAFDKVAVSGIAELGGTLTLELGPTLDAANLQGRSFVILTSKQLAGTFGHIAGLGSWGDKGYAVEYFDGADADSLADSVRITFNNVPLPPPPVPEPEAWALLLAGLGLVASRTRRRTGVR